MARGSFHQDGLAACVLATIKDREPKVKAACYEAAAIVEDWRSQCVGGFRSAIDLFELAILPSLLYNSDAKSSRGNIGGYPALLFKDGPEGYARIT